MRRTNLLVAVCFLSMFLPHVTLGTQVESLESIQERILADPNDQKAYQELLNFSFVTNAFPGTILFLTDLVTTNPNNYSARHTLAYAYKTIGDVDSATREWRAVTSAYPQSVPAVVELSTILLTQHKSEDATALLAKHINAMKTSSHGPTHPLIVQQCIKALNRVALDAMAMNVAVLDKPVRQAVLTVIMDTFQSLAGLKYSRLVAAASSSYRSIVLPDGGQVPGRVLADLVHSNEMVANLYDSYGQLAIGNNMPILAEYYFLEAFSLMNQEKRPRQFAHVGGNLGHYYWRVGRYADAERIFEQVIQHTERRIDTGVAKPEEKTLLANNYLNASEMAWDQAHIASSFQRMYRAQTFYTQALAHAGLLAKEPYVHTFDVLVQRYLALNNYEKAGREVERLNEFIQREEIKFADDTANVLRLKAEVALRAGKLDATAEALKSAEAEIDETKTYDHPVALRTQRAIAALSIELVALQKQGDVLDRIENFLRKYVHTPSSSDTLGLRMLLLKLKLQIEQGNNGTDTEELMEELDDILPKYDPYGLRARFYYLAGNYYEHTNNPSEAVENYKMMLSSINSMRAAMPITDDLYQSEQQWAQYFAAYANLLIRRKQYPEALEVLERSRALTLLRALGIQNRQEEGGFSESTSMGRMYKLVWQSQALAKQIDAAEASEVKKQLTDEWKKTMDAAQEEFQRVASQMGLPGNDFVLENILNDIRVHKNTIVVVRADQSEDRITEWWIQNGKIVWSDSRNIDVADALRNMQSFIHATRDGRFDVRFGERRLSYAAAAEEMQETFIAGLSQFSPHMHVTVIPDGNLLGFPIASLYFNGQPLLFEQVDSILFAPSLAVLGNQTKRHPSDPPANALFIGIKDTVVGQQDLLYVEEDADVMSQIWKNNNKPANSVHALNSGGALKRQLDGQGLIVLGAHGMLDPVNPMNAEVRFSNARIRAYEMFDWPISGSRVILSACEVGGDVAGLNLDLLGMTFPLFVAGARSVLHALWDVDQKATSMLMREVVKELAAGKTMNQALADAQRAYVRQSPKTLAHPRYWAAWRVVGMEST